MVAKCNSKGSRFLFKFRRTTQGPIQGHFLGSIRRTLNTFRGWGGTCRQGSDSRISTHDSPHSALMPSVHRPWLCLANRICTTPRLLAGAGEVRCSTVKSGFAEKPHVSPDPRGTKRKEGTHLLNQLGEFQGLITLRNQTQKQLRNNVPPTHPPSQKGATQPPLNITNCPAGSYTHFQRGAEVAGL